MLARAISSLQHPIVKKICKLKTDSKLRKEENLIPLTGDTIIEEVSRSQEISLLIYIEGSTCKDAILAKEKIAVTPEVLEKCPIPKFVNKKEIRLLLAGGRLYKNDSVAQVFKDYLIHPRVIQCRLEQKIPFGDCDDHAIYWCTALKKSKLAKKVWFSFFTMKGRGTDDTYQSHAVCVFIGNDYKLYWCDYSQPRLIKNITDFQVDSANLYGCDAVCAATWEVVDIKQDDTPVFGKTMRILPPKK
jgi:hypothetical protein